METGAQASLIAALRQAGAHIVDTDPAYALSQLYDDLGAGAQAEDDGGLDALLSAALDDLAA